MTCTVGVNGDSEGRSAKLRTCRLEIPEDAHQGGRYNELNYPVQELG